MTVEKPRPIAEALAALNEAFNVTTVALDVRTDETGFAARLDPKIGVAVLALVNAVLSERDESAMAAIKSATERLVPGVPMDASDILIGTAAVPHRADILDDLELSILRIIQRVRDQRRGKAAPTAEHYASVARLCRLVEEFDGLNEALSPTGRELPRED